MNRKEIVKRVKCIINKYRVLIGSPLVGGTDVTLRKLDEIVIAENGIPGHEDSVVVMGYFEPVEESTGYEFAMERLGDELRGIEGVLVAGEA